jgi:hypothetical protein
MPRISNIKDKAGYRKDMTGCKVLDEKLMVLIATSEVRPSSLRISLIAFSFES